VRYNLDEDEQVTEGVLEAFDALGYDLSDQTPPLSDFIAPHPINTLRWSNPHLRVLTSVWQHPVEITSEQIIVYRPDE
jgi:hypothetical protein